MLSRLSIQNFALIEKLTLEFSSRLNVLTGETGAGKSILIDAIRFVLGERMDAVRPASAESACSVEAVFEITDKKILAADVLSSFIEEGEGLIILRKEVNSEGRSRAWINNKTVTSGTLKEAGALLLDIHGQYDHQQLLDGTAHAGMVDRFAKNEKLKEAYQRIFGDYRTLLARHDELAQLEEGREREMDLLKYQVEELEKAELQDGEEEELKTEHARSGNSEKLHEHVSQILNLLNDEDESVSEKMGSGFKSLNALLRLDPSLDALRADYEDAQLKIEEIIRSLKDYQENLSFDPERLAEIEKRLDVIDLMKRKYGNSIPAVLAFLTEAKKKYDQLANKTLYEKEIDASIKKLLPSLTAAADALTESRKKAAAQLRKTIETELKDLEIKNARFEVLMEQTDFGFDGCERVEFMMSPNLGQPLLPLQKIISGGEASRVMLAMKKALMKVDPMPTLIFDEIDANIGGRLGTVTGEKLKEISSERQVLLITHLPQIASFADRHFKVSKEIKKGKTVTEYAVVDGEARVSELAQMMSGKQESEISKKHAEEMLRQVSKSK